jgi:hypothetical protein
VTDPALVPPPAARGPLDQAYARGLYAALLVFAVLPVLGLLASGVELALALGAVRAADVAPVTAMAIASPFALLAAEIALFVVLLRRRVTGPERPSWVLPILVAVASVVAYGGGVVLRIVTTRLIAAHGPLALATHSQRLVGVQLVVGVAGCLLVATVLLVAFGRARAVRGAAR